MTHGFHFVPVNQPCTGPAASLHHVTQTQPRQKGLRVIQKGDTEKILEHHKSFSIMSCDALDFRLRYIFPVSNMAVSNVSLDSESSPSRIVGHDLQRVVPGSSLNCHFEYREDPSVV